MEVLTRQQPSRAASRTLTDLVTSSVTSSEVTCHQPRTSVTRCRPENIYQINEPASLNLKVKGRFPLINLEESQIYAIIRYQVLLLPIFLSSAWSFKSCCVGTRRQSAGHQSSSRAHARGVPQEEEQTIRKKPVEDGRLAWRRHVSGSAAMMLMKISSSSSSSVDDQYIWVLNRGENEGEESGCCSLASDRLMSPGGWGALGGPLGGPRSADPRLTGPRVRFR